MKKNITIMFALICSSFLFAQKMKVESGDFAFLKGLKEVNVEFVYDNLKLYNDNRTNDEYVKVRTAELEEKTKGVGTAWAKKWVASRELIFAPKFLELMNRYLIEERSTTFGELPEAKYTLIVESVWIYPGYNAGVMKQPSKLTTKLTFVETANRSNTLLVINAKNAPGTSFIGTYSNDDRIGESYAKTGKTLAGLILKKTKK